MPRLLVSFIYLSLSTIIRGPYNIQAKVRGRLM